MDEAVCEGADFAVFFPARGRPSEDSEAKSYCRRCPVVAECLEFALSLPERDSSGIWGNTTAQERRRIRRERRVA